MGHTVLIVDDHADFRASARAMLEAAGFDVVGDATTGVEALAQAQRLEPTLVLLDIKLPDLDGISVAEQLATLSRPPDVVLTSTRDAAAYGPRLRTARARGFLAKAELSGPSLARLLMYPP
ncbi:MAG: response regulator transcription factor [Dietzia sp.]|nr:response regulator transcription factor [Dietzia sp.]